MGVLVTGLLLLTVFVLHSYAQSNDFLLADPKPAFGTFYSLQKSLGGIVEPPLPFNPYPDADVWACFTCDSNLVRYFYDDRDVDYQVFTQNGAAQSVESESGDGDNDWAPAYNYPSNSLYLEITGLSSNLDTAFLLVHGTQVGQVYELKSTVLLTNHVLTAWNTEQSMHGSNDVTATSVPLLDRTNTLFFWARLWTTNDQNSNSIPDWWEWENFGNLNQATNGDFDSDGINNLQEYLAGTDPNTIDFSLSPAKRFVNSSSGLLQVTMGSGAPSSMAVLVDSTNFASASWTSFSPNPVADLGTTDGWHRAWVGLRGRKVTSQQTWQTTRLKLDTTPPQLIITNPVSTNLSRPLIQLGGYCPEPLTGLTYDLTNSSGLITNQPVLVMRQGYSTNTWEFTTNYFQGFDIHLESGVNLLTLRATDIAGNTSTTNFTFVVDYSGNTNPPFVQLFWPRTGTHVGANTFTWRGWVDDPSAQIAAQLVDTNGVTNLVSGRVGRDGTFRIDGLPMNPGTNTVSLTVSNVIGGFFTTNIAVVRSTVTINFDWTLPIQPTALISGEISEPGYTIWVNGVMADQDEYGWVAWDSPLTVGSTVAQIRAIPNSDNGGHGSGGSGGASLANEETGNPNSNDAVDIEVEVDPAQQLYNRSYFFSDHTATGLPFPWGTVCPHQSDTTISWEEQKGGGGIHTWLSAFPGPCDTTETWPSEMYTWPGGRYPNLPEGLVFWPNSFTNQTLPPCADSCWEESDRNYTSPTQNFIQQRQAQVELVLETGGPASSTEKSLWLLTAGTGGNLPQEIGVGALGHLDVNGMLFVMLADRTAVGVTPNANPKKPDAGNVWVNRVKYALISTCVATSPADRARTNIGVGEEVDLAFTPPLPTNALWTVSAGNRSPAFANHTRLTAPSNAASVTVTVNVGMATLTRSFRVIEPTGVDHADFLQYFSYASTNQAGAGMRIRPYIGPTNVSFYRAQILEVGQTASSIEGYFATHTPPNHDSDHGADHWIGLR